MLGLMLRVVIFNQLEVYGLVFLASVPWTDCFVICKKRRDMIPRCFLRCFLRTWLWSCPEGLKLPKSLVERCLEFCENQEIPCPHLEKGPHTERHIGRETTLRASLRDIRSFEVL
jgi:hypothetical protein